MNKKNIVVLKMLCIFVINFFLYKLVGNEYLKRFNDFIKENNSILIKNEINSIIKKDLVVISDNMYSLIYNDKKEIINIDLNINEVNKYLSNYINIMDDDIHRLNNKYLNKYYDTLNTKNNIYYLLPLGMISDNPFIYNTGPKIILYYDFIFVPTLKIEVNVKNYGLNNALVDMYLIVHIDQNILKPVLTKVSSFDYNFLLSSRIINGRVSNYLGTNLNVASDPVSSV